MLYIDPVECIDCGACVPVCPVAAIFALDDLPEKWKHYTEINASYVQGGARRVCQTQGSEVDAEENPNHSLSLRSPSEARSVCPTNQGHQSSGDPTRTYPWLKSASPSSPPKNLIAASSSISYGRSTTAITLRLVQIASPALMF